MTAFNLTPDGPHSDDHTRQAAQALAETVRVLNHATRHPDGVTDPATINAVLGDLRDTVARLDQLLEQLYRRLNGMYATGRLNDTGGHPARELQVALTALADSRQAARPLASHLTVAYGATSGMYADGGEH